MSNIVAIVKSLVGQVFAISVEGLKRQIFEGERLLQGEQVMAGLGGEVTLQMANGELINLGEGNTWQAGSAEAEETDNASDASLEQALAAGFDPTVDLEAPAAGPGATGGAGGAAGGGHSFILLDETGLQFDPTIGFPTEGLNFANAASVELAGALDNGNTADTADSGTNTGTAGNSGGNGAGGETGQANSAPNALADTFTLDEDGSVAIDVLGNDTDLDGDTLSITQVDGQPISEGGSVSVSNGSVTLSGNQLVFTPNTNYQGPANFTYTISDGALTSTATVSGTINPVADLIAADDSASGNEDSVINASVTGNDSTTSGGTLSYALASDVSNGSLTLNADGSYSYTPNANFNGSDSFTYTVTDAASGESRTQTVSLTINPASPINNAPAANGTVAEQNDSDADAVNLDVSSFFADIDGDALTYSASGLPTGLSIDSATGIISGTLDNSASQGGNSGAYSITVTATDPDGASVEQTFTWNVANPAPVAANDTGSADEDNTVTGDVLDNDNDPDGDALSVTQFVVAGDPTTYTAGQNASVEGGTLVINGNGSYSFTPAANWNGTLPTVTYSLSDGEGGSDTATLIITVNPVNDAPNTNGTVAEQNDIDADAVSLDVSSFFADIDGDTLTYSASGLPAGLNIDSATGIISGTLDNSASQGGNSGAYSITVTATDPDGASVEQTFTWNVANPAPVAANDTGSADEDNTVTGDVLDNDNDPDGDALSVTQFVVAGDPTTYTAGQNASVEGGTLVINGNGSYSFTPAANWNGTLPTVTYSLSDGEGGSDTATLIITVNPVNDAPSISAPDFIAAVEDISTPLTGISFSDIDAAAGDVVATLTVASGMLSANSGAGVLVSGAGDTLSLTGSIADINAFIAAAQVSYTGAQDASGDVELTLSLDDNGNTGSGGAQIASTTSVIQIAPVADAPIINLTLGAVVETTTTIDTSNAQSTDQGFTISAFSVNGNPGSISLNNSPLGFGVAGGASGNNVELGQNATGTERLNVVFDTAIASATVRFAWLSTVESAEYKLFDSNGLQIGGAIVNGVTDLIDPPITLTGTDNALISRIEFTAAAGVGNDYLINSISYVTSSSYPLTISVTPTDIDNSESISAVAVSIPSGATLSTGTFDPVEGTWSLPLVSDGSYVVSVDPATQAVTISGLEMTIPGSVSGTPNLITTATIVDGSDSVNAIFGSAGNDLINGSADDDILSGGLGNDSLNGNTGADTFLWRAGDTGNDVISDFNAAEGDRIDLSDLLQAENQSNILDYLRVDIATSTLEISTTGSLDVTGADVTIKLENGGVAVDLSSYGATSSDIVNSLIAGADPLVKVDHT